jgi:F-type H+-transporting ATPase subunit b
VITYRAARPVNACEFMNKLVRALCCLILVFCPLTAIAQERPQPVQPAPTGGAPAQSDSAAKEGHVDAPPNAYETQQHAEEHPAEHGGFSALLWPTANFAILAFARWWFLRQPIGVHLTDRHQSIRKDLVEAANVKAAAAAQLVEIERKLQALPGELEALKRRGAEEIAAEEQRIAALADAERERLLEQTRREIDLQVRLAKRALVDHAAELSVQLAGERIQKTITPADQNRLVDRYLHDVAQPPAIGGGPSPEGSR